MNHYRMLAINLIASGVVMYLVMFTMIDGLDDFYNNANMVYMTLTMIAPMGVLMLVTMSSMYHRKGLNAALYAGWRSCLSEALYSLDRKHSWATCNSCAR